MDPVEQWNMLAGFGIVWGLIALLFYSTGRQKDALEKLKERVERLEDEVNGVE